MPVVWSSYTPIVCVPSILKIFLPVWYDSAFFSSLSRLLFRCGVLDWFQGSNWVLIAAANLLFPKNDKSQEKWSAWIDAVSKRQLKKLGITKKAAPKEGIKGRKATRVAETRGRNARRETRDVNLTVSPPSKPRTWFLRLSTHKKIEERKMKNVQWEEKERSAMFLNAFGISSFTQLCTSLWGIFLVWTADEEAHKST